VAKQKSSDAVKADRFNNAKFINYELTLEEQATCKRWLTDFDEYDGKLFEFLDDGYKVSVKRDVYNNCFSCTATHPDMKLEGKDLLLTGRGSTPYKAVKQCLFKHYVVFEGEWGGFMERRAVEEIDD
jgi:hypothetical protein